MNNHEENRIAALTITGNMSEVSDLWNQLDYFYKHGTVMSEPKVVACNVDDLSLSECFKKYNTLGPKISRAKNKLKTFDDGPQRILIQQDIDVMISDLNNIKEFFTNPNAYVVFK